MRRRMRLTYDAVVPVAPLFLRRAAELLPEEFDHNAVLCLITLRWGLIFLMLLTSLGHLASCKHGLIVLNARLDSRVRQRVRWVVVLVALLDVGAMLTLADTLAAWNFRHAVRAVHEPLTTNTMEFCDWTKNSVRTLARSRGEQAATDRADQRRLCGARGGPSSDRSL